MGIEGKKRVVTVDNGDASDSHQMWDVLIIDDEEEVFAEIKKQFEEWKVYVEIMTRNFPQGELYGEKREKMGAFYHPFFITDYMLFTTNDFKSIQYWTIDTIPLDYYK